MPAPFVFSVRVKLVCGLVTVTAAPTSTAPLGSVTRPVIWPKVWANRGVARVSPTDSRRIPLSFARMNAHPLLTSPGHRECPDWQLVYKESESRARLSRKITVPWAQDYWEMHCTSPLVTSRGTWITLG